VSGYRKWYLAKTKQPKFPSGKWKETAAIIAP
jgi:hypothetical protein